MATNRPNVAVQTFLTLVKWFLLVLVANNLIWAAIHFGYIDKSFSGTEIGEIYQTGQNNNQEIANVGTKS